MARSESSRNSSSPEIFRPSRSRALVRRSSPSIDPQNGYFDRLTYRYRIIAVDYPVPNPTEDYIKSFTADRVCSDILSVADAANASRFAWFGFSWGAVVGLQLASRTKRLTALALGGWPPLGGQYKETLAVAEADSHSPYGTFYRSIENWNERKAVSKIKCPRMVFVGSRDEFTVMGYHIRMNGIHLRAPCRVGADGCEVLRIAHPFKEY